MQQDGGLVKLIGSCSLMLVVVGMAFVVVLVAAVVGLAVVVGVWGVAAVAAAAAAAAADDTWSAIAVVFVAAVLHGTMMAMAVAAIAAIAESEAQVEGLWHGAVQVKPLAGDPVSLGCVMTIGCPHHR
jgi:hypothetical protein